MNLHMVIWTLLTYNTAAFMGASPSPISPTATVDQASTHTVAIGKGGFTFIPDTTYAAPGDTIEFQFYPLNHSVVQATYGSPCIPIELTSPGRGGFHSGFKPMDTVSDDPPAFSVIIGDSSPIFFYCSAPNSCIGYGMVGAINPNGSQTVDHQRGLAKNSTIMLNPGEPWPSEETSSVPAPIPTSTSTDILTATSAMSSSAERPTSTTPSSGNKNSLSPGGIIGTALGILIAACIVVGLLMYLGFARRRSGRVVADAEAKQSYVSDPMTSHPSLIYTGLSKTTQTPYIKSEHSLAVMVPTLHRTPSEHRQAEVLRRMTSPSSERSHSMYGSHSEVSDLTAAPSPSHQVKDYSMFDGSTPWR